MLPYCFAQSTGFNTFNPGGGDLLAQLAVTAVPLWLILIVVVHVLVAWYVHSAALRLAREGHGPALFPPYLWGLASLVGVVVVPFGFALLHYCTLFEPDEDVPWSRGGQVAGGWMMGEATDRHRERVAELHEELDAARGARRRRSIRGELQKLEGDPSPGAPGQGPDQGPDQGPKQGDGGGSRPGSAGD